MQAEGNIRDRSPSAATQTQRGIASGLLLGFLSAGIFGFVTPLARFSYEFGVNPATAALFRLGLSALVTSLLVLALRRRIRLPRAGILPVLGMTITLSATVLCYLSAVAFIPVSLAVLIFYTYPLLVAVYTSLVQRVVLGVPRAAAFVVAFSGLAVAIGPSFEVLDDVGVLLAAAAAMLLAGLFLFSERALRHVDVIAVTFYSNVGSVPVMIGGVFLLGGLELPTANVGWVALVGSGLCYALGIFLNFAAINFAGPARTAIVFNLEPVVAMMVAAVLLDERLSLVQYAGGALIIGALVLASVADRPRGVKV